VGGGVLTIQAAGLANRRRKIHGNTRLGVHQGALALAGGVGVAACLSGEMALRRQPHLTSGGIKIGIETRQQTFCDSNGWRRSWREERHLHLGKSKLGTLDALSYRGANNEPASLAGRAMWRVGAGRESIMSIASGEKLAAIMQRVVRHGKSAIILLREGAHRKAGEKRRKAERKMPKGRRRKRK